MTCCEESNIKTLLVGEVIIVGPKIMLPEDFFNQMPFKKQQYIQTVLRENGLTINDLLNVDKCTRCGGDCCKKSACGAAPCDFDDPISVKSIMALLDTGNYMLTVAYRYEGKTLRGFEGFPHNIKAFPYIAAMEKCGKPIHISPMRSQCKMLGPNGCLFPHKDRLTQGLFLIPRDKECEAVLDLPDIVWTRYRHILEEVVLIKTGKSIQELFEEEWIKIRDTLKKKLLTEYAKTMKIPSQEREFIAVLFIYGQLSLEESLIFMRYMARQ